MFGSSRYTTVQCGVNVPMHRLTMLQERRLHLRRFGPYGRHDSPVHVCTKRSFCSFKLIRSPGRIHHPFLLADNRHYTFYVWRRVFRLHPLVPYTLIPGYIACAWAWYLRIGTPSHKCLQCLALTRTLAGQDQTLLQTLLLPVFVTPTLLPTPLLEPRYFLIPYILLRAQVNDVPWWGVALEGVWYAAINAATMWVFLYKERVGVGRFMW